MQLIIAKKQRCSWYHTLDMKNKNIADVDYLISWCICHLVEFVQATANSRIDWKSTIIILANIKRKDMLLIISDLIAEILGKMSNYVNINNIKKIRQDINNLNEVQTKNILLINKLRIKFNIKNKGFLKDFKNKNLENL